MRHLWWILSLFVVFYGNSQDYKVVDRSNEQSVAFATIAFGNGYGTFADGQGVFRFTQKLYADVDTLTVSSLGYENYKVAVADLTSPIYLSKKIDELETVVLTAPLRGYFKEEKQKAVTHDDYENCWLPTVQSEIAVRYDRVEGRPTQISHLQIPILLENNAGKKRGNRRRFSTMFRVSFYDAEASGIPFEQSTYPEQTFVINQESEPIYELDITGLNVNIPKDGLYVAIQVLGYTKPDGELINSKKYREIRTATGTTKVLTTFRPLLPFIKENEGRLTYVRRRFYNDQQWQKLDLEYNALSKLVRNGYTAYGMGARFRVFEN